ncbi:uncharacterized protein [Haliotis cracherodii]|uniref:uncharacterized protein n=1 Tax=Haliotis cracherodii TaxID=6455 RepID=UPI0039E8AEB7
MSMLWSGREEAGRYKMTRYIFGRALGLTVFFTLCCTVTAANFQTICGDCVYKGGAGYVNDPSSCYGFFECDETTGQYTLLRCPSGMSWDDSVWSCVGDPSCVYPTSPTTTPDPCTFISADPANPAGFLITSNGIVSKMNCAPGSLYDSTDCKCGILTTVVSKPPCTGDLYIPCAVDTNDHSGNMVWVANTGVTLATVQGKTYSACRFAGGAYLSVPFFKNNDLGDNWTIKFNYQSTSVSGTRVLVSNSMCSGVSPSVEVTHTGKQVCVNLQTTGGPVSLCAANTGSPPPNLPYIPVTVKVHNGELILANGLNVVTKPVPGDVLRVKCPLTIGKGEGRANYEGLLWNFQVFKCNPDSFTNPQDLTPATPLP